MLYVLVSEPLRITPACAGKSSAAAAARICARDHPRVCGEKVIASVENVASKGSPPRMRGKEEGTLQALYNMGITPACAGKSKRTDCR